MDTYYTKALEFDKEDVLSSYKDRFIVIDQRVVYLDGNSLGRLPKKTASLLSTVINNQWGDRLIRGWNEEWLRINQRIAGKIARLVGARDDEIFVGDTTSLNLYKLAYAVLRMNPDKKHIVSDTLNFPTDLYIVQGLIRNHFNGHTLMLAESNDGITVAEDALLEKVTRETALVTLSHVAFKSAFMYDMKKINTLVHARNSLVMWDVCHAVGAVPLNLHESDTDMAVGCTYKYLNGGPGAPAFLYVRKGMQPKCINPIWGWFSHRKPFDFDATYDPCTSIQRFATGTPGILSLAAIEPGVDMLLEAGMDSVRRKSLAQSGFLMELIREFLVPSGFTIASPPSGGLRGSHISLQHAEGYRIDQAMIAPHDGSKIFIPDFRPPDNIRLGIAPLYTGFMDLYECVKRMEKIVKEGQYKEYGNEKSGVV